MKVQEYRVPLPMTVEQYHKAQLFMIARTSLEERSVDVVDNRKYQVGEFPHMGADGQYTLKRMGASKHLPGWLTPLFNASWCVEETAWNAYPLCKTEYTVPMLGKIKVSVDSMHLAGSPDLHNNALNLSPEILQLRKCEILDIGNGGEVAHADLDPRKFRSSKAGIGPLDGDWLQQTEQNKLMTCYKVVTVQCELPFGLQGRVEAFIVKFIRGMVLNSHRKLFCWMDEWFDLTMADIRQIELDTQTKLREIWLKEHPQSEAASPRRHSDLVEDSSSDEATIRTQSGSFSSADLFTGYLMKLADGYVTRGWNLRYFMLQGPVLQYFGDARDPTPREVINLLSAKVVFGGDLPDRDHGVTVTPLEHRPLIISGKDQEESRLWCLRLQKAAAGLSERSSVLEHSARSVSKDVMVIPPSPTVGLDGNVTWIIKPPIDRLSPDLAGAVRLLKQATSGAWPCVSISHGVRIFEPETATALWRSDVRSWILLALALAFVLTLTSSVFGVLLAAGLFLVAYQLTVSGEAAASTVISASADHISRFINDPSSYRNWDPSLKLAFRNSDTSMSFSPSGRWSSEIMCASTCWGDEASGRYFVCGDSKGFVDCFALIDASSETAGVCTVVLHVSTGFPWSTARRRVTHTLAGLTSACKQDRPTQPTRLILPPTWKRCGNLGGVCKAQESLSIRPTSSLSFFLRDFALGRDRVTLKHVFASTGPSPWEAISTLFANLGTFFPTHENSVSALALVSALLSSLPHAAASLTQVPWTRWPAKVGESFRCHDKIADMTYDWKITQLPGQVHGVRGAANLLPTCPPEGGWELAGDFTFHLSMETRNVIAIRLSGNNRITFQDKNEILSFELPDLLLRGASASWVGQLKVASPTSKIVLEFLDDLHGTVAGHVFRPDGSVSQDINGTWLERLAIDGTTFWSAGDYPQRLGKVRRVK